MYTLVNQYFIPIFAAILEYQKQNIMKLKLIFVVTIGLIIFSCEKNYESMDCTSETDRVFYEIGKNLSDTKRGSFPNLKDMDLDEFIEYGGFSSSEITDCTRKGWYDQEKTYE